MHIIGKGVKRFRVGRESRLPPEVPVGRARRVYIFAVFDMAIPVVGITKGKMARNFFASVTRVAVGVYGAAIRTLALLGDEHAPDGE
jgi:hypothetical protein